MSENNLYDRLTKVFVCMAISIAVYISLISNGLTNTYDGLWASTYNKTGNWELATGRWVWPFLDRVRGGYAADPLNSLLTLLFITLGTIIALSLFGWKKHFYIYVLLMLISQTVCNFLSYRFMAPTFGAGYLLAVIAAWLLVTGHENDDKRVLFDIVAIMCLILSLGCYQALLGVYCIVLVVYIMNMLLEQKQGGLKLFAKAIVIMLASCGLYYFVWKVALKIRHISAANYKGADSSIIDLILSFPANIVRTYNSFLSLISIQYDYVFGGIRICLIYSVLIVLLVKGIIGIKQDVKSKVFFIILYFLIPVSVNIYQLFLSSDEGLMLQMSAADILVIPLALIVLEKTKVQQRLIQVLPLVVGSMLLYGNIYMVGVDIDAMQQGTDASKAIMYNVSTYLTTNGLYNDDYEYAFVGKISDNSLFYKNENWDKASDYAQYGNFWTSTYCMYASYQGVLYDSGISLPLADEKTFEEILNDKSVMEAPCYPEEGSVIQKDNIVIIKMADYDL